MNRPDDWSIADEWFADFIHRCESMPSKRARVKSESTFVFPPKELRARALERDTEQKLRWLRRQAAA